MNPLDGNSLRTREDVQRAVADMFEQLMPAYTAGGARVSLGATATTYDRATAELEAFARPLWGIVPLAAGGAPFTHWDLFRQGLIHGTDPHDPQYWGAVGDSTERFDQRMVEMAPIGLALALVPEHIFDPLSAGERARVLAWLDSINRHAAPPNNWQFFRVLVNLGFARVGGPVDRKAVEESLATIESYYLSDGWYREGELGNVDFYIGWAFHFYCLIYAVLAASTDPDRATRFRERAHRFAADWEARFDATGRVVPYGRSLTYRFAADAFWGALAFAGEEALPWAEIHGLWAKHLRWWCDKPIWRADGVLSIGWTYPDLLMSETYNGPGSPYWAFKAFLPLALPAAHPFWATTEADEAGTAPRHSVQRPAVAIVNRDDQQAQMLNGGRGWWFPRQGAAKYGKFAYSSAFDFSLDPDDPSFAGIGDSMLFLRDDEGNRRVRTAVTDGGVDGGVDGDDTASVVWTKWEPFPDVKIVSILCGEAPWHARIHHIQTGRALETFEGGFAIPLNDDPTGPHATREASGAAAVVRTPRATSLIADAGSTVPRQPAVHDLQPNTHLSSPRAAVLGLQGRLTTGTHMLVCVVAATEAPKELTVDDLPSVPERAWQVLNALTGERFHP